MYLRRKWQSKPQWIFGEQSIIVDKYPQMLDAGNYYNVSVDMTHIPNFPGVVAHYCSTDHDFDGFDGIYMSYTKSDGTTLTYDEGLALGDFDYLPSKPSANPIYKDNENGKAQCETPYVIWVEDTFVLTYQVEGVENQSTLRALGADGVNFTYDTIVVSMDGKEEVGDGHTGYTRCAKNILPDFPDEYIGASLHGGQGYGWQQILGCNDPRVDVWETVHILKTDRGSIIEESGINGSVGVKRVSSGWDSMQQIGRHYYSLTTIGQTSAGAGYSSNGTYWIAHSDDATDLVSVPIQAIEKTGASNGLLNCTTVVGNNLYFDSETTSAVRTTSVATIDKESGPLLEILPRQIAPPPSRSVFKYDFNELTQLPSDLEFYTETAGSYSFIDDATVNNPVYQGGIDLSAAFEDSAFVYKTDGFVPADCEYVEIYLSDYYTPNRPAIREMTLGFSANKTGAVNIVDGIDVNSGGTSGSLYKTVTVGGTEVYNTNAGLTAAFGWYNSTYTTAKKCQGIRWYPQLGLLYCLDGTKVEYDQFTASYLDTFDLTKTLYPYFGIRTVSDQGVEGVERVKSFEFSYKLL
jgi:hypothetical protein